MTKAILAVLIGTAWLTVAAEASPRLTVKLNTDPGGRVIDTAHSDEAGNFTLRAAKEDNYAVRVEGTLGSLNGMKLTLNGSPARINCHPDANTHQYYCQSTLSMKASGTITGTISK